MGCMLVYDIKLVFKLYEPVCLKELAYDGKLLLGAFCKKNLVVIPSVCWVPVTTCAGSYAVEVSGAFAAGSVAE